jgi:RHS repeat-associated protein
VTVKNQSNALVAEYRYNGLGYRIGWHYDTTDGSGGGPNGTVDSNDPWYYFVYDLQWRPIATYRGSDSHPKERFVFHNAGANGLGGSSYVDLVVLRDRDMSVGWSATEDYTGTALGTRIYYCQNWRADVSVIVGTDGTPIEWVRYSAYGVPTSYALADVNHDGVLSPADQTAFYAALGGGGPTDMVDIDFDGNIATDADINAFSASYSAASTGGRGVLSRSKTDNRIGYAGYQWDPAVTSYHVRHRVYRPDLGRWLRRDPAGNRDGLNMLAYVHDKPTRSSDPYGLCARSDEDFTCQGECSRQRNFGSTPLCTTSPNGTLIAPTYCCICINNLDEFMRRQLDEWGLIPGTDAYNETFDAYIECQDVHENTHYRNSCAIEYICNECNASSAEALCLQRRLAACKSLECTIAVYQKLMDALATADEQCEACHRMPPVFDRPPCGIDTNCGVPTGNPRSAAPINVR